MASGSKRGRRSTSARGKKAKKNQNPGITEEILLFVILGVSILLLLGTCGLLGSFGKIVRSVMVGIFGMVGFIVPFGFFFACTFWISNKWEKVTKVKLVTTFVLLWVLSCVAQLIFSKDRLISGLKDYYTDSIKNGGFLGGVTTHFLCKYLGMAGTIVILVVLFIICVVLISDRSLFTSVKEGSKMLSEDYRRNAKYRREVMEVRNREREERDMARWEKRNARHEEYAKKQEEKRAAALEERRKKVVEKIEKRVNSSERRLFEATDFKNNAEYASQDILSDNTIEENAELNEQLAYEIRRSSEPESMFYGNSTDFISTVREQTLKTSADVTRIMEETPGGLLSATKLSRDSFKGDMVEITGEYNADEQLVDFVNNINTSHRINISSAEDVVNPSLQEAYERDVFVDDSETFADDYSDVVDLFSRRRQPDNKHHISKIDSPVNVETYRNEIKAEKYVEDDIEEDVEDDVFEFHYDDSYQAEQHPDTYGIDLEAENAKPAPVSQVVSQGKSVKAKKNGKYKLPPVTLLNELKSKNSAQSAQEELRQTSEELVDVLHSFGLDVKVIGSSRGPAVTRYELQMPAGVSVKKITNLSDDIMMSLGAKDIRIEAPIPGKKAVGIEIPNRESTMVHFRELIDSREFKGFESKVAFGVGKDLSGDIVVSDISKMPHLLIAGATGSGKSVCINTLIMSILFKAKPDEVKLIMIDPKMVELSVYNDIPHLLIPVVTDAKKASAALAWAVNEMTSRYQRFSEIGVRDMKGYNNKIQTDPKYSLDENHTYMPQIVIVVDELADLMMVAAKEVEESICRLAQLARAAGIYLILATQRPSVDVITGLIKANMPSRIAFSVSSQVDSRTILDSMGAEKLLGNGDMLFFPRGYNKPSRVQGAFVSDDEVERVVDFVKSQTSGNVYDELAVSAVNAGGASSAGGSAGLVDPQGAYDELFTLAGHAVIESDKASIGMLQRKFKIGFNRAARIMDQLSDEGVVGPEEGTKPRKILMSMEQFNLLLEEKNHS